MQDLGLLGDPLLLCQVVGGDLPEPGFRVSGLEFSHTHTQSQIDRQIDRRTASQTDRHTHTHNLRVTWLWAIQSADNDSVM